MTLKQKLIVMVGPRNAVVAGIITSGTAYGIIESLFNKG